MRHKEESIVNHTATVRKCAGGAIQAIDLTTDTGTHYIEIGTPILVRVEGQSWLGLALVYSIELLSSCSSYKPPRPEDLKPGQTIKVEFKVAWCYRWHEYFRGAKDSAKLSRSQGLTLISKWRDKLLTVDTTYSEVLLSLHMDPLPAEVIVQPVVLHVLPTTDVSALEILPSPFAPPKTARVLKPGFVARRYVELDSWQVTPVGAALKALEREEDMEPEGRELVTNYVALVRRHLRQTQSRIQSYTQQSAKS